MADLAAAMQQREAQWQAKAATRRADEAKKGWTRATDFKQQQTRPRLNATWLATDAVLAAEDFSKLFVADSTPRASYSDEESSDYGSNGGEGGHGSRVNKGKFIVCDHCRSHGLPCDEDAVCYQCIYHGVACVHHWCKLSRKSKEECPRSECHYVHEDYMPTSVEFKGFEWLVVPGNLRGYMCAGRKGKVFGRDEDWEPEDVKAVQEDALADMGACVARGEATWDTIVMTCDCVSEEEEANEQKLERRMARNRRNDPDAYFFGMD